MSDEKQEYVELRRTTALAELVRAVEAKAKIEWYPYGSETMDHKPLVGTIRCFTYENGYFPKSTDNLFDLFVWVSSMMEHWFKVPDVLDALDNAVNGHHGLDKPMAIIRWNQ